MRVIVSCNIQVKGVKRFFSIAADYPDDCTMPMQWAYHQIVNAIWRHPELTGNMQVENIRIDRILAGVE